jgi:hypothetical protein
MELGRRQPLLKVPVWSLYLRRSYTNLAVLNGHRVRQITRPNFHNPKSEGKVNRGDRSRGLEVRTRSVPLALVLVAALGFRPAISAEVPEHPNASYNEASGSIPDLSGLWQQSTPPGALHSPYTFQVSPEWQGTAFNEEKPPMTPWAEAKYNAAKTLAGPRGTHPDSNDPVILSVTGKTVDQVGCFPPGVPKIYLQHMPFQIFQIPGQVIMLFEFDHLFRIIYTDGRGHSTDMGPTWMGDSIGKWEGDTLVVDTIGFNDKTWLDWLGHPHSDQLHLVERIRRVDHNTLRDDITFDDPKAYTKPWAGLAMFELKPDWRLEEMVCEDAFFWTHTARGSNPETPAH